MKTLQMKASIRSSKISSANDHVLEPDIVEDSSGGTRSARKLKAEDWNQSQMDPMKTRIFVEFVLQLHQIKNNWTKIIAPGRRTLPEVMDTIVVDDRGCVPIIILPNTIVEDAGRY